MPQMIRELLLIIGTSGLAYLIMVKADQQMLILLKGRLHKSDLETRLAEGIWRRHKGMMPNIIFPMAGAFAGLAIIFLAMDSWAAAPLALLGVFGLGLGVWSRVSSFCAADKEIKVTLLSDE